MRVMGSSKGPGPFTTKRKDIVAARKEADATLPKFTTFKTNMAFDTYRSRTVHRREDKVLEAKARVVQANISELYAQKDLLNQRIETLKDERAEALSLSRGEMNYRLARKANEGGSAGPSSRISRDVRSQPSGSSSDPRLHRGPRPTPSSISPNPRSFASIAMKGDVSEGDIILLQKPTNPAFAITDWQYRARCKQWSGGGSERERLDCWKEEESDQDGRGRTRERVVPQQKGKMVDIGWRQEGHHQKANVSDRGESNEEWETSPERVIINNQMYTLVHLDKKSRMELLERITPKLPQPTCLRKLANIGLAVKNKGKAKHLYDSGSHGKLSDMAYEKFLAGVSSEEGEEGEVIRVGVERSKGKEPLALYHEAKYPIWNVKGLCYLAVIKASALEMFMWKKNITLKEFAKFSKNFRHDDTFYITEEGKDRLHLSLQMPHN
jgi:hypothetical protein